MSKLDRFLVSKELLANWPSLSAKVLECVFSDHCPIMLKNIETDFGPVTFRFFNHWMQEVGFNEMIKNERDAMHVNGCASFVRKENLKV